MSKNVNIKKKESFEFEDRISNVIITPKNKEERNKEYKNNNFNNNYLGENISGKNILHTNTIKNSNTENIFNDKKNSSNFSNAEIEFMNGIKDQIAIRNNENLITLDQEKLFETFILFQKFLSNQPTNINCNFNDNNIFDLSSNNSFNNKNLNRKNNIIRKDLEFLDDKSINDQHSDLIQIKTNRNVDMVNNNSNIVNEFKRNFKNNNISEYTDSNEKINFLYENKPYENSYKNINLENNQEKLSINLNYSEKKNFKNNPKKMINSINDSVAENGLSKLKIKNKAISYDFRSEIEKNESKGNENNCLFKNKKIMNKEFNNQNPILEKDQHPQNKNNLNKDYENNNNYDPNDFIQNSFENISNSKIEYSLSIVDKNDEIIEKNPDSQIVDENNQINKKCKEKDGLILSFSNKDQKNNPLTENNNFQKFESNHKISNINERSEVKFLRENLSDKDILSLNESLEKNNNTNLIKQTEMNTSKLNKYNIEFEDNDKNRINENLEKNDSNHDYLSGNFEDKILKINENNLMNNSNSLSINISQSRKNFEDKKLR